MDVFPDYGYIYSRKGAIMPYYSVATTKDQLSRLIDKALAGEEVVITRHGKPIASLRTLSEPSKPSRTNGQWMEWLRERRESIPSLGIDGAMLIREMRDEGAH